MPIPTVILEDEERSLQAITFLIHQLTPDIELVGSTGYVDKGAQLISERMPRLVFMDIRLADGTGFDVLRKVASRNFEVIFIAAQDVYSMDALKASAVDYLLKPIGLIELEDALSRAIARIGEKKKVPALTTRKIGITTQDGYEFIEITDILWCTSEGSYTHFFLLDGSKVISSRNLGFYEKQLCANNFYRIHNSTIINLRFIKSYIKGRNSYIVLTDGAKLEISQRRKSDFLEMFFPER